jgi:hypothetical protein
VAPSRSRQGHRREACHDADVSRKAPGRIEHPASQQIDRARAREPAADDQDKSDDDYRRMAESGEELVLGNESENSGENQGPEGHDVVPKTTPDQQDENRGDDGKQGDLVRRHADTLPGVPESSVSTSFGSAGWLYLVFAGEDDGTRRGLLLVSPEVSGFGSTAPRTRNCGWLL